jgi:hypothetical protein
MHVFESGPRGLACESEGLPCAEPGLGVKVNEKAAAAHPFVQEKLQSAVYAGDGSVLDW